MSESRVHSLLLTQAEAKAPAAKLYSDHLPIHPSPIPINERQEVSLASWNILDLLTTPMTSGFGKALTSTEEEKGRAERIDRISTSIVAQINERQLDIVCLQECRELDFKKLFEKLPQGWRVIGNPGDEQLILYNARKFNPLPILPEKKWTKEDGERLGFREKPVVQEVVFEVPATNTYICVNNVHYSTVVEYDSKDQPLLLPDAADKCTAALLCEDYHKKYKLPKQAIVVPIVIGDMNSYVAPLVSDIRKDLSFTTGVRPPAFNKGVQLPNFTNGCFIRDASGEVHQQPFVTINPETAKPHEEKLPNLRDLPAVQASGFQSYVEFMTCGREQKLIDDEINTLLRQMGMTFRQSINPLRSRNANFGFYKIEGEHKKAQEDLFKFFQNLQSRYEKESKEDKIIFEEGRDYNVFCIPVDIFYKNMLVHRVRVSAQMGKDFMKDVAASDLIKTSINDAFDEATKHFKNNETIESKLEMFRIYYVLSLLSEKEGAPVKANIIYRARPKLLEPRTFLKRETWPTISREKAVEKVLSASLEQLYSMAKTVDLEKFKFSPSRADEPYQLAGLSKQELEKPLSKSSSAVKVDKAEETKATPSGRSPSLTQRHSDDHS